MKVRLYFPVAIPPSHAQHHSPVTFPGVAPNTSCAMVQRPRLWGQHLPPSSFWQMASEHNNAASCRANTHTFSRSVISRTGMCLSVDGAVLLNCQYFFSRDGTHGNVCHGNDGCLRFDEMLSLLTLVGCYYASGIVLSVLTD